jgi:cell division initiation protein
MKANALKESNLIVSEAGVKAEKMIQEAERTLATIKSEIQEMKRQKMQFEISFKNLLEKHLKMLTVGND